MWLQQRLTCISDETNVFLQSKSQDVKSSVEESALVFDMILVLFLYIVEKHLLTDDEVFLKVLEYYRDIMFLTINQIAQFNIAVQFKMHIALKYNVLNENQTCKIFKKFVDQIEKNDFVNHSNYNKIVQ